MELSTVELSISKENEKSTEENEKDEKTSIENNKTRKI